MGSRRPQEGRRNQMQNKHERFWEEAQPQVGVWAASAVYGGTEPQVSLSRGGTLLSPPPPPTPPTPVGCSTLQGSRLQSLRSTWTPSLAAGTKQDTCSR